MGGIIGEEGECVGRWVEWTSGSVGSVDVVWVIDGLVVLRGLWVDVIPGVILSRVLGVLIVFAGRECFLCVIHLVVHISLLT